MRDKLNTFILKNPPEAKKGSKDKKAMRRAEKERLKEGEAADEELKKLKKEGKKKGSSSKEGTSKVSSMKKKTGGSDDDHVSPPHSQVDEKEEVDEDEDDDVQWQTDTSLEAARQRIQEQLSAVTADMVILSTNESEQKMKVTSKASNNSNDTSPRKNYHKAENGNSDLHETLVEELKTNLKKGVSANQLKSLLGSLSGSGQEKMSALLEALFNGIEKGFAKEVVNKKNYLAAAVTHDEGSQLLLLKALESFCGKAGSSSLKEVALVLKALYDADVLEEEYILQWYQEGLKGEKKGAQIWKNAKPFIDWLHSAESESEEE
ncbi:hypothetical protein REPUB_Repub17cG0016100 [Reevesia pubescens]